MRVGYFLKRALKGMRQAVFVNVVAVVTIAIALFVVAVFAGVAGQVRSLLDAWGQDLAITVYLRDDVTAAQREAVVAAVREAAPAATVSRVTRQEALSRLRASLGDEADVLAGLEENPLPESLEIRGARTLGGPASLERFAKRIGALGGVDEVDWGREWVGKLEGLLGVFSLAGFVLGGLILLAAAVMVSNTIKLAVFARRDEIEIMKLCGATDGFVRAPFLIEGVVQGVLGALLSSLIALGVWALAAPRVQSALVDAFAVRVDLAPPGWGLLWLVLAGAALGLGGSALSLGRFLKV